MPDKTKFEQGQKMLATLITQKQRERTDAAITRLRIEWAKMYGDRLPPLLTEHLAVEAAVHPEIIAAGHGIGPQTDDVFRIVAKEVADGQPFVQRALDAADAQLKADIRAERMAEIPPTVKMQMARDGVLDARLDAQVQAELDARHAVRTE
ncbi:MAG: hypothetical protein AAGK00_00535 [Pseudomonadota bacterium]